MIVFLTESVFEDLSADEMLEMLENVDLDDASQADSAIDIVDSIVGGAKSTTPFANKYETSTTTTTIAGGITETSSVTSTTTSPSTTTMTETEAAVNIRNLLQIGHSLTETSGLAPTLSFRDFEIRVVST